MNGFIKAALQNHISQIIPTAAFSQRPVRALSGRPPLPFSTGSHEDVCALRAWSGSASHFEYRDAVADTAQDSALHSHAAGQCTSRSLKSARSPHLFPLSHTNHLDFRHFVVYHGPCKERSGNGRRS